MVKTTTRNGEWENVVEQQLDLNVNLRTRSGRDCSFFTSKLCRVLSQEQRKEVDSDWHADFDSVASGDNRIIWLMAKGGTRFRFRESRFESDFCQNLPET
jgi:hypothetical protein